MCVRACVCVCGGGGGGAVLDDNHNTECVWFCLVCCDAVYRTFLPTCASPRLWFERENLSVRSRLRSVLCLNVVHCCATNYLCIDWWPGRHLCSLSVSFSVLSVCLSVSQIVMYYVIRQTERLNPRISLSETGMSFVKWNVTISVLSLLSVSLSLLPPRNLNV